MLQKTQGIVINYFKYKESSIIVNIYTEAFGMKAYIENGVRSIKSKNKIALFQHLTQLDLVVYEKKNNSLQRISELKCSYPYQQIPYQITKSSIALFLSEILYKTLKEEESNPALFNFLQKAFVLLDESNQKFENFHLHFLIQLSSYLGFFPETSLQIAEEFRLNKIKPFSLALDLVIKQLLASNFLEDVKINSQNRAELLEVLLRFYSLHVANFEEIKSLSILKEVFIK